MPLLTPGSGKGRYIVRAEDPKKLAEFIFESEADPELELADLIGPAGAPHTAVFLMPHEKAKALQERFCTSSDRLIIERDRPLSLFENGGD
ncbi:MAG TPA: hypothetical protein VEC01_01930 [Noviherbaspirillum sp.]|uniref:hypothetical protein n=1 Tax=Noviherbaspirillum sp. TaxID=1926288 RepID=UPI002D70DF41|nr:hypothetical protein [Noviherbaspirillum sp.]HYD94056.1 hypothetical protein [Noviherbaspirillum sp.]